MIKTAIFDLDGTLLDTSEFIYQAFDHTIKTHNIEFITRKEVKKYMGMKLSEMYKIFAPHMDTDQLVDTHRGFQKQNLHLSKPYLKVEESLDMLQKAGIKMAVVTARSKITSIHSLELAGIKHFFEMVISDEDVSKLKPDPEGILMVLNALKTKPEEAIMIGDTFADVLAGKNAGTKTMAVLYGFHGDDVKKYYPDYVVYSFAEIPPIILDTKTSH